MKIIYTLVLILLPVFEGYGQTTEKVDSTKIHLLQTHTSKGCACIDSINIIEKTREKVADEVSKCIEKETVGYQMMSKLLGVKNSIQDKSLDANAKKEVSINIDMNTNSGEYKKYYFELERSMMENCPAIKSKVAANELTNRFSLSNDRDARSFYSKGQAEDKKQNFEKAIEYYEEAVKIDPNFAFAWDNMGLCYRKLGNYDKAIEAYKKSLEIDPIGMTPLQNIAMAYMYKKEYYKAIDAYKRIETIDKSNPEVYYGLGNVYAMALKEYEKGLDYICKAYNIYTEIKSPYRSDAEKVINMIFSLMKQAGKEEAFNRILQENHISPLTSTSEKSADREKIALANIRRSVANRACACVDTLRTEGKTRAQVFDEVRSCIKNQLNEFVRSLTIMKSFSAASTMMEKPENTASDAAVPIMAPTKEELRQYYYDIERVMYARCRSIRKRIDDEDIDNRLEVGDNPQSRTLYSQAKEEFKQEKYQASIDNCEKAIALDPNFAFAWNTIAQCRKKEGDYKKAISACNESMYIDSLSMIPHLMKASLYRDMKQPDKAVEAYSLLVKIHPLKPEPYYELGKFYFDELHDTAKGLENMCTAHQVFSYDSPPIKADIEKYIRQMYTEMKNAGQEELFEKIRKEHKVPSNIKP